MSPSTATPQFGIDLSSEPQRIGIFIFQSIPHESNFLYGELSNQGLLNQKDTDILFANSATDLARQVERYAAKYTRIVVFSSGIFHLSTDLSTYRTPFGLARSIKRAAPHAMFFTLSGTFEGPEMKVIDGVIRKNMPHNRKFYCNENGDYKYPGNLLHYWRLFELLPLYIEANGDPEVILNYLRQHP